MEGVDVRKGAVGGVGFGGGMERLMGSEGFGVARVSVGGESEGVEVVLGSKIEKCGLVLGHRGHENFSESSSCIKKTDTESCRSSNYLPRRPKDDMTHELNHGRLSNPVFLIAGSEEKQLQGKTVNSSRNGNCSLKRLKMLQVENPMSQADVSDMNPASDKQGLVLTKCANTEKTQMMRTKSNLNSKRSERRNSKAALVKGKCDPGVTSFNLATGGSSSFGLYGLKPETHDITHLLDDISLNELLDGSYNCPNYGEDKGKGTAGTSDNIMDSVKKAFSILRVRGSGHRQQPDDVSFGINKKASGLSSTSGLTVANSTEPEAEHHQVLDLSSSDIVQKSCINAEVIDDPADIVLQPGDVLEQLMLPSPKDLEFLLHDTAKLAAPSKISDPRSAKTTPHRLSLPPLPWSHGNNGHCKSNYDASKLSCRSVCQGRWVRITNTSSFFGGGTNCSVELGSLAYDSSLVPAGQVKYSFPLIGITSSFPSIPGYDQASSSGVCKTASSSCTEPISSMDCKVNDPQSPRLLIAAQTLFDIARQSSCQDPNGMTKWLNNSSPKAMKARKMSSTNESVERSVSRSETTYKDLSRLIGPSNPFKKPKLPMIEKKGDFSQMNPSRMRNYYWPPPTSSRSSPIRFSQRDNVAGERYSNGTTARQLIMIPPPPRVPDKSNNGQQKPRKVVPMDWARTRS
ncbi:hypothetical protein Droror1_Dr00005416 [Drosera rotundifolia]